ncbi:MAG: methylase, partial [Proteobacteria bacterium]|nr:methylase [Pseudomonadota bacterium]
MHPSTSTIPPLSAVSLPAETLSPPSDGAAIIRAGETLLKSLASGRMLDASTLRSALTLAFGGSDTEGKWIWKSAYEAVEVAQVLFLRKYLPAIRKGRSPASILALLEKTAGLLPTHTRRSEEGVQLQQFSTPMKLAYLVSEAAALTPDDVVLEPSAGTGQLAIFAESVSTRLALNELGDTRADILAGLFPHSPLTRANAEHIHDHLDPALVPSVVLMNPPFSASPFVTGTMRGVDLRHLKSALRRLSPGGRLVAITSFNLNPDTHTFREAFRTLAADYTLQLCAGLDGKLYRRHATTM